MRAGGLVWIGRRPPEPKVAGSNPARPAITRGSGVSPPRKLMNKSAAASKKADFEKSFPSIKARTNSLTVMVTLFLMRSTTCLHSMHIIIRFSRWSYKLCGKLDMGTFTKKSLPLCGPQIIPFQHDPLDYRGLESQRPIHTRPPAHAQQLVLGEILSPLYSRGSPLLFVISLVTM